MAEYDSSAEIFQNGWDGLFLNKKKSDLGLTQGSKSPYPLFLLLKNANRYKKDELNNAFKLLSNADIRLKSSGEDPTVVIEDTIIRICHSFQTQ
jgi:DNA polymerase-3 subunit delta